MVGSGLIPRAVMENAGSGSTQSSRPPFRPVAMLTHSYYEEDPRVRREAEALVGAGRPVDVFALRRPGDPPSGRVDGVRVIRLDVQRHQGAGLAVYLAEYLSFFVRAGWTLARAHAHRRYSLVQVHTLPDFLVFAALPLRLTGTRVLLDLHEAMPEFFATRFPRANNRIARQALRLQERASIAVADHVVTVNDALVDRLVGLGIAPDRVSRVRNSPSLERFDRSRYAQRPFGRDAIRLIYAGALTPTYEVDVAIRAIALLMKSRSDLKLTLDVYGRGDSTPTLDALVTELGLTERVRFHGRIPIDQVPAAIAAADIGLAPTRRTEFTDVSLSTKVFEYAAMDKPVVCSALPMIAATFPPGSVWTYRSGDPVAMADVLERIVDDPAARAAGAARARGIVTDLSWEVESRSYLSIVERLTAGRSSDP